MWAIWGTGMGNEAHLGKFPYKLVSWLTWISYHIARVLCLSWQFCTTWMFLDGRTKWTLFYYFSQENMARSTNVLLSLICWTWFLSWLGLVTTLHFISCMPWLYMWIQKMHHSLGTIYHMSKICRVHGWELMIQRYVLQQGLLLLSRLRMSFTYIWIGRNY